MSVWKKKGLKAYYGCLKISSDKVQKKVLRMPKSIPQNNSRNADAQTKVPTSNSDFAPPEVQ